MRVELREDTVADLLVELCDFVTLHVPLTGETGGLVDDAFLAQMRRFSPAGGRPPAVNAELLERPRWAHLTG